MKKAVHALGLLTLVSSFGTHLFAGAALQVPEIDATSMSSGLGVLAAGILIVRSRMRSR